MKLFRKTKQINGHHEVAQQLADKIINVQHRIADYLNHRAKKVPRKSSMIALATFCIVSAGYLTYLLISALN